jgi:hypothetical protein
MSIDLNGGEGVLSEFRQYVHRRSLYLDSCGWMEKAFPFFKKTGKAS